MEFNKAIQFYASSAAIGFDGFIRGESTISNADIDKLQILLLATELKTKHPLIFTSCSDEQLNFKCKLIAGYLGFNLEIAKKPSYFLSRFPVLLDKEFRSRAIVGANSICKYLLAKSCRLQQHLSSSSSLVCSMDGILDIEETELYSLLVSCANSGINTSSKTNLLSLLDFFESKTPAIARDVLSSIVIYPTIALAFEVLRDDSTSSSRFTRLKALVSSISLSPLAKSIGRNSSSSSSSSSENKTAVSKAAPLPDNVDEIGLFMAIKNVFTSAILVSFPEMEGLPEGVAVVARCGNAANGDFQCNNAMSIAKLLKASSTSGGRSKSPKEVADDIVRAVAPKDFIEKLSTAPNGFINIVVSSKLFVSTLSSIVTKGVQPPKSVPLRILVDFSSPNIAKEMHVGHLRSTIIGDAICRVFEFCGHDVLRVNHVGDWGTQFGMLITYLQEEYPDILTNPPNISDLTAIYKLSKKRFDEVDSFKERSRLNVVKLQSFDPACIAIWTLLCNISRAEFQKVYDLLGVSLTEVGESFYNPAIPKVIDELQQKGLVEESEGMLIVRQDNYEIPLIVRKSDGGFGYDSTDMTALSYRLRDLKRDWIVYVTDAGQASHFYMCFDAAKKAGWIEQQRLDHIGFGVVQGEDGKRFKTRSSETVRLIDLLDAAKDRMYESLVSRANEGKCPLVGDELVDASKVIGYGAVKYFDLKQHPSTNYVFSYDRMLDVKGDTAVYLLFAYARVVSILRKAEEEKSIDVSKLLLSSLQSLDLKQPVERSLAFELMQFNDMIANVMAELLPNRLCDYLKEVCVKFTDFVTKCHVLNATVLETNSRLILCEATRRIMRTCFDLLGIGTLERI